MDITSEDVEVDINTNEVLLSPTILEYMADNLVYSEMNRIISYMMNVYANDNFSALNSDQNFASMFFLGLPGLNFVKEDGIMVIDAIHSKIKVFTDKMKTVGSDESKLSEEEQLATGVTPDFVRLSIGLEDADDLIDDLSRALDKI